MTAAATLSTAELLDELTARGVLPACQCGKWRTYFGAWDQDGYTLRCAGCLKAIAKCRC